ncbi:MAG: thiamine phosphate synthase [Spirochaetaceae bacterium]
MDYSLYLITAHRKGELETVAAAVAGGVRLLQFRHKGAMGEEDLNHARELQRICRSAGIPFIVNDHLELAHALGAEGVHLGQRDGEPERARRLLGPSAVIGVSVGSVAEAIAAQEAGADYLGAGDVFGTSSKADVDPPIGLEGLGEIVRAVSIPVVAIGGVTVENAGRAVAAGAAGVAVISAIYDAADPEDAAGRLSDAVRREVRG